MLGLFPTSVCPKCRWATVRPSMHRKWLDHVMKRIGLRPYRCRSCRYRFYRLALRVTRGEQLTHR